VFGVVVLCFVAGTIFTHLHLLAIDRASMDIAENAAPSIERLAAARGEIRRTQILLRDSLDRRSTGATVDPSAIHEAIDALGGSISDYLKLPVFPEERELWTDILRGQESFSEAVARCLSESESGNSRAAEATYRNGVSASAEGLSAALTRTVEFNATQSHDLALRIKSLRGNSTRVAFGLDALSALVAVAGAIVLHRAMRSHAELAERHRRLLEERASELEQFAGRIAHDILSPLGTVGLVLKLAETPGKAEEQARYLARGDAALERVQRLVEGLLEFARAGARPDPHSESDVAATVADVANGLQADAAEAGVALDVNTDVASEVACNPGVLTSLVSNLARNAIKYIGDAPVRSVEIRAFERGDAVRVEVEDTGPGLPPGLEDHVFEPYVRASRPSREGIGLGLATVKRLVDGHGGRVGVDSVPGKGCTFWFELPKVKRKAPANASAPAHAKPRIA
jgi:signal transduction histidine kinase